MLGCTTGTMVLGLHTPPLSIIHCSLLSIHNNPSHYIPSLFSFPPAPIKSIHLFLPHIHSTLPRSKHYLLHPQQQVTTNHHHARPTKGRPSTPLPEQRLFSDLLHRPVVDPQQLQSHFLPTTNWQCNSSLSPYYTEPYCVSSSPPNKRKAEFDAEEEEKEAEAGENDSEISMKTEKGISSNTCSNESSKLVKKPDFIHVRARRGQATDSHSLAERARREKISKKMKCLQDLVPGCERVTGKAGMLDEIINYVQSLQKQVEFLSMKLATANTSLDFSIDSVIAKQMPAYLASLSDNSSQQGTSDSTMDLSQKPGPIPEVFLDLSFISQLQQLSGWESDWPTRFN